MTTKANFKVMFKRVEFNDAADVVLVDMEGIDSMVKLARITTTRASKLGKAIRSPGGSGAGTHVTKGAEHHLVIVSTVANNTTCVSRSLVCAKVMKPDSSQFEKQETQRLMEEDWDNKTAVAKFAPLPEKEREKGWKYHSMTFRATSAGIRGINTRAPLAYLLREDLIPGDETTDR